MESAFFFNVLPQLTR